MNPIPPPPSGPRARSAPLKARDARAFTLIELMTVMSIIIILAGLVVGISSYANRSAIESRTKAEIKAMETALEAYKADYGAYPPLDQAQFDGTASSTNVIDTAFASSIPKSNGWLNVHFVYRALSGTNTPKTYMTFTPKQISTQVVSSVTYTLILDPNGNPYGYAPRGPVGTVPAAPGTQPLANPATFDLFSAGVDGKSAYPTNRTSNVDDIGNWQR